MRPYLRVGCFPKYKQIIYWISSSKRLITDIFPAVFSKEASAKLENIRLTDDQSQPNSSPHFYNTLYSSFDAEINWLGSRAERNTTQKYMQVPLRANYILDTYVFLHCRAQLVFPNYLGKFQFIYNFRTHVFLELYIRKFTAAINFPCENWRKWRHFLKNTTRVEIIIRICTAIRIKEKENFSRTFTVTRVSRHGEEPIKIL